MRRWPIPALWALGMTGVLASVLLSFVLTEALAWIPEVSSYYEDYWWPTQESLAEEINTMRGPWTGWFLHNGETALGLHFFALPFGLLEFCMGMMLVGMALLRSGFFSHGWSPKAYLTGAFTGIIGGWLCTTSADTIREAFSGDRALQILLGPLSGPLMGFGYLCLMMHLLRFPNPARILAVFAPAGRMALTLYLMQSVIGAFIFYGWGLGNFEKFNRTGLLVIAICIFSLQLVFAHRWLARFSMGPLEWLWRRLSYGSRSN